MKKPGEKYSACSICNSLAVTDKRMHNKEVSKPLKRNQQKQKDRNI